MVVSEKLVYSIDEIAEMFHLHRNSVYHAIQHGELPSIRIGRRIVIPAKALERLLEGSTK